MYYTVQCITYGSLHTLPTYSPLNAEMLSWDGFRDYSLQKAVAQSKPYHL